MKIIIIIIIITDLRAPQGTTELVGTSRPNFGELVRTSAPSSRPRSQGGQSTQLEERSSGAKRPKKKNTFFHQTM